MRKVIPYERVIRKFAWLPIRIDRETRWLEMCFIKQHYAIDSLFGNYFWVDDKFLTEKEYTKYLLEKMD